MITELPYGLFELKTFLGSYIFWCVQETECFTTFFAVFAVMNVVGVNHALQIRTSSFDGPFDALVNNNVVKRPDRRCRSKESLSKPNTCRTVVNNAAVIEQPDGRNAGKITTAKPSFFQHDRAQWCDLCQIHKNPCMIFMVNQATNSQKRNGAERNKRAQQYCHPHKNCKLLIIALKYFSTAFLLTQRYFTCLLTNSKLQPP